MWIAIFLFVAAQARAATAQGVPPPILDAVFGGTPESFEVVNVRTEWRWRDDLTTPGPLVSAHIALDLRLPAHWSFKSAKATLIKPLEFTRKAAGGDLWHLEGDQETATGSAAFDFLDEQRRPQTLTLTLTSRNPHPYVLIHEQCPDYRVRLEPVAEAGRYLFLVVKCMQFADDIILYFARSSDAKWVASDAVRDTKPIAFEFKMAKSHIPHEHDPNYKKGHVLDLRTEDQKGLRAEYKVFLSETD